MLIDIKRAALPRLREERMLRGWSQRYVAEQIGAERYYISRWERGIVFPSSYYREKLCQLFNLNTRELGLLREVNSSQHDGKHAERVLHLQRKPISSSFPHWHVPYRRNPFFTGREEMLNFLRQHLSPNNTIEPLPQALCGLGGVGKTQLALEYAYRYRDCYQSIFWIQADTHETLISSILALTELLNLTKKGEQEHQYILAVFKKWLSLFSNWLLIFDAIEDLHMLSQVLPISYSGYVLLTTRNRSTGSLAEPINLSTLSLDEGVLLLLHRTRLLSTDSTSSHIDPSVYTAARTIAEMMDGFPLALDQAGAYIDGTHCSLTDFLHLFQKYSIQLLDDCTVYQDHPSSIVSTFEATFKTVEYQNLLAMAILQICAFLAPDPLPLEILIEGACALEQPLQDALRHPLVLNKALAILHNYSLMYRDPENNTLTVHRLVQAVLRETADQQTQCFYAEIALRLIYQVFPSIKEKANQPSYQLYVLHAQACLALIERWNIVSPSIAQFVVKLTACLQKASERPPSGDFFTSYCKFHPQAWCSTKDLWHAYQEWTHATGERFPLNHRAFTQVLRDYGCLPDRTKTYRLWRGVTLQTH